MTSPEEWSFVGFYRLREQQADFNKVFLFGGPQSSKSIGPPFGRRHGKRKGISNKIIQRVE
ncbi:hypothetical protein BC937DRAFT_86509, partial [Endogone sp. FLAS-F59071]